MNANAVAESAVESREVSPADIPAARLLYWSLRRELWENRSLYLAPLAAAVLFLTGFMIGAFRWADAIRRASALSAAKQQALIQEPFIFASLLLMATTFIVTVFYCLDALHSERRDRSILFWKSLPVSDRMTVLSKASIPVVVMPLITFVATVITQWLMLALGSVVLAARGVSVVTVWTHLSLFPMSVMIFCHLLFIHGLWYAPFYAWLMLVSAWARRAVFVWAALPLLILGVFEKLAFNSAHFAGMLMNRLSGGPQPDPFMRRGMRMDPMNLFHPLEFVTSPGLWSGLIVTALFLFVAIRLRRNRQPN